MMNLTDDEIRSLFAEKWQEVRNASGWNEGRLLQLLPEIVANWDIADYLYEPDDALRARLDDYNRWYEAKTTKPAEVPDEDAGQLMEEIAYLAFRCLKGHESIKSFQSYAPQHDLVISGNKSAWYMLIEYLHLDAEKRTIIVEAKNQDNSVSDAQFSRLCGIVDAKYDSTSQLGVFFREHKHLGFQNKARASLVSGP